MQQITEYVMPLNGVSADDFVRVAGYSRHTRIGFINPSCQGTERIADTPCWRAPLSSPISQTSIYSIVARSIILLLATISMISSRLPVGQIIISTVSK